MSFFNITPTVAAALQSLSLSTTEILLFAVVFLMVVLLMVVLRNTIAIRRLAYPVYDYTLRQAEEQAKKVVDEAKKEATRVKEKAVQDGESLFKQRESESENIAKHYEQQLQALAEHNKQLIDQYAVLAKESYKKFDIEAKKESETGQVVVKQELEKLLGELRDDNTKLRRHFAKQYEERLDGELASVREDVAKYRAAQLRMIDQRIVALVERATALALQKELSVREHTDSIFRSLEEAKKEGVL